MTLLAEHALKATPGRGVLQVYDVEAYEGDEAALDAAEVQVVAGNGYHLYLLSLQPDMAVQVVIRVWDTPPSPPADAEGHVNISLESATGILVIGQLDSGPAGDISLPRPGVYDGHAWWQNREAAAEYYASTLQNVTDDTPDGYLVQAWEECPVVERYVLDLAYIREPEPVNDPIQ
ncbi:hypothetical protein ACFWIA_30475 [Streptomyces sp. NPDC127068]|uniref:hypothetical protein n=1 Tax=Streptomyces sp. NPDC127068 TaxID=3347127 RepID=UPI0036677086